MKKFIVTIVCVLLVAALSIGLFACNPAESETDDPVDTKAVFIEALSKLFAADNYTAQYDAEMIWGNYGAASVEFTKKVAGSNTDTYGKGMYSISSQEDYAELDVFESYFRDFGSIQRTYLWADCFVASEERSEAKYGYEMADEDFRGYAQIQPEGKENLAIDNAFLMQDYGKYLLAMAAEKAFDQAGIKKGADGSITFELSLDLLPYINAKYDMDKSAADYYNGMLSALGSDKTVQDIIANLRGYANDTITVGGLVDKIDELMKSINPAFSFENFVELYLWQAKMNSKGEPAGIFGLLDMFYYGIDSEDFYGNEVRAEDIYVGLADGFGLDLVAPRNGEGADAYIYRLVGQYKDVKLVDIASKINMGKFYFGGWGNDIPEKTLSIDTVFDIILLKLENTNYLRRETWNLTESDEEYKDNLAKLARQNELLASFYKEYTIGFKVVVDGSNTITSIDASANMKYDASDWLWGFQQANEVTEAYNTWYEWETLAEVPETFKIEDSVYDDLKDWTFDEFFQDVLDMQLKCDGMEFAAEEKEDTGFYDWDGTFGLLKAGGYSFKFSVAYSAHGTTEVLDVSQKITKIYDSYSEDEISDMEDSLFGHTSLIMFTPYDFDNFLQDTSKLLREYLMPFFPPILV